MKFAVTLFFTIVCSAATPTCSRVNFPAVIVQGQTFQPAIVDGVDDVSYSMVRFQWKSDATVNRVNYTNIVYATAAQWAAKPGVYPQSFTPNGYPISSDTTLQGNVVSNLIPDTAYHIAGQSSSDGGSTFCPASQTDTTFRTLPQPPAIPLPTPPQTFSLTEPTITGTDRIVGVTPECPTFAACVSISNPGDGIGIRPGSPVVLPGGYVESGFAAFKIPSQAIAVGSINLGASKFTVGSVAGLANGEQVHFGSSRASNIPSPMNPGVTYSLINLDSRANTFQASQDGTNPLSLKDAGGGTIYVVPWPLTQAYIVIHSTASPSDLPPSSVKLDPVAYGKYLGVIEAPSPAFDIFEFGFNAYLWFRNIELTFTPSGTTATDPPPNVDFIQGNQLADHIVFDQCWFHAPPAPDRIEAGANWGGTNQAVVNSVIDNVAFWKASNLLPPSTVGANQITINAGSYDYPTSANTLGTCSLSSPVTFNVGGAPGSFYVSLNQSSACALTVTANKDTTVNGNGVTVSNVARPSYPVDNNASCLAYKKVGCWTQLLVGRGTWDGRELRYKDVGGPAMPTIWGPTESAIGWRFYGGPGPYIFRNNTLVSEGITGPYFDEYTGNACYFTTPCPYVYNTIDLSVVRNTITWDPHYFKSAYLPSPLWNGSYSFGRNAIEMKQGSRIAYDGNIVGPVGAGLSNGECWDLFSFYGSNPLNQVNSAKTADISITNNTCYDSGSIITMEGYAETQYTPPNSMQRIQISNNLFLNNNGYLATGIPHQNIAQGRGIRTQDTESVTITHNTFYGQAGRGSSSLSMESVLSGGWDIENNIFSYSTESGAGGFVFDTQGAGNASRPTPAHGTQGTALLAYLHATTFARNAFVGTWSNGNPSSLREMTGSAVKSAAALYPGDTLFPNGSSLAKRIEAVGWASPGPYAAGDFHLVPSGPGINQGGDGRQLQLGADIDALEAAQGKVSGLHAAAISSHSATIQFVAPDSFGCTVDWGTSPFWSGSGTWTRVANSGGQRAQSVPLSGLPAASTIYYRANCAVMQPTGTLNTL